MPIEFVVADLDGVVYRGRTPISGSAEAIDIMRQSGKKVRFLTNNATSTAEEYSKKLNEMGIEVGPEEILTSGIATAIYIRRFMKKDRAYVVGSKSLAKEMEKFGVDLVNWDVAEVVVVSLDQEFTYDKLHNAARSVTQGCPLIATNRDPTVPTEDGFVPGAGSIVAAVEVASSVSAMTVGKPSAYSLQIAEEIWSLNRGSTCIVGDRLDTDIAAGNSFGWRSVLVFSGSTKPSELNRDLPRLNQPSAAYRDLRDFVAKEIEAH